MANMARKTSKGVYQIGIYQVEYVPGEKRDMRWTACATGPGTIGNGYVGSFRTLRAAHQELTGEAMDA